MAQEKELIIKFTGRVRRINPETGKLKYFPREAPVTRINGKKVYHLPPSDEQIAGFTHESASELLSLYPKEFKVTRKKGK